MCNSVVLNAKFKLDSFFICMHYIVHACEKDGFLSYGDMRFSTPVEIKPFRRSIWNFERQIKSVKSPDSLCQNG
jgi:hypothetical protein